MKQIDDLFLNAHYGDLTPQEQSLIQELCSDELSFQQVKVLATRSKEVLPVSPPESILESLNHTFDQTYTQAPVQRIQPRFFNLFVASAVAASLLIFLTIYYFGVENSPQEKHAKVEKKTPGFKDWPKNKKVPNTAPHPKPAQNPQLAVVESVTTPGFENESIVAPLEQVMDEHADVALVEKEDAKPEVFRGSRSDDDAPTSNTYEWTTLDKNLNEVDAVVIAASSGYSSPKGKRANVETKRINTALMLKQIKPVY